ncbi:GNAT family N-acetyltransferase [Marivita sp. GX14005]|uniref:GNAT family N-acetyltransferase n=1 Tax=Marivita sp. GX14005 TaxID=2942276 RepID=UPI002018DC27|nr:GNAT family N-acetyltransferase [Marivita sp. GX14005]MCL3881788.1 GNAT family N-acetyltransferase [Marivita sp. GX14005]
MSVTVTRPADPAPCYALRHTVFVEEQNVPPELERDALDASAIHLLASVEGTPMGAARIVLTGDTGKIGRVCVLPEARGTGLGASLIREALHILNAQTGITRAVLGAQLSALTFYEKLGFTAYGEVFDDAGIDHRMMEYRLPD